MTSRSHGRALPCVLACLAVCLQANAWSAVRNGEATRHATNAEWCGTRVFGDVAEFVCPPWKGEVGGRDLGVRQTVRRIGSGDFTLNLDFSLEWSNRTAASIGFSSGHRIGFDGRGGIFTEGGQWRTTESYGFRLEAKQWYHMVAVRKGGVLNVSFDGVVRIANKPMIGRVTSAQVRPWRNKIRLRTLELTTLNRHRHFNSSEAKFAANLVAASYYPLAQPIGRHPQHCIDSGRLWNLPHDVAVRVVLTTTQEVRGAPVSVTIVTATPGRDGAAPDIYVAFPGVAGDQQTREGELRRMMDSFLHETPREVRSLRFLEGGRARVLPHFHDVFEALWPAVLQSVRGLLDEERLPAPSSTCEADGSSCLDSRCCQDPGRTCFAKNEGWAACRADCSEGEIDPYDGQPWSCDLWSAPPAPEELPGSRGRVIVAGHSLGGAVADLAAVNLAWSITSTGLRPAGWRPTLYTMGQPRTGNFAFASIVEGLTESWRIVHGQDPVAHMPPCSIRPRHDCEADRHTAHYHHGIEIWYEHSMGTGHRESFRMCEAQGPGPSHNACSMSLWAPQSVSDHRYYFGIPLSYQCLAQ